MPHFNERFELSAAITGLIDETIATLTAALAQQILITALVILIFLLHVRASLVVAVTLPVLLSTGRGADVAKAMAWPVFGGMVFELLTLFVAPVAYCAFKEFKMNMGMDDRDWRAEDESSAQALASHSGGRFEPL